MNFTTNYNEILGQLDEIDPLAYGKTRNFIDGAVTRLSPYISKGVISTRMVMDHVIKRGFNVYHIEKFIQELAWRDYWQQVWIEKGDGINEDLKNEQWDVENHQVAKSLIDAKTGIQAIDDAIEEFYENGYLHNHIRMYIAAIACNIGKSHWRVPAQWMYYHLLDGDWASNALSWQWVSGANANKKYVANQDNINKYCYTKQNSGFLNVPYTAFENMEVPDQLARTVVPELKTPLPEPSSIELDVNKPLILYNFYNLDPTWRSEMDANRVLLLEPSIFDKYPISQNSIDFMMGLAENIEGLQAYVGSFEELTKGIKENQVFYKEHPLNQHYKGVEDPRDWMFSVKGYFPSFFGFWKKCRKELK